jgi:hypothetical protein
MSILERQTDPIIRENMITHLKNTYLDAINYGFKRAKCVHAKILNDIEEGTYTWRDGAAIAHARQTHIQRPLTLEEIKEGWEHEEPKKHIESMEFHNSSMGRRRSPRRTKKLHYKICKFYNDHKCELDHEHKAGGTVWRQACMSCRRTGHREDECRRTEQ